MRFLYEDKSKQPRWTALLIIGLVIVLGFSVVLGNRERTANRKVQRALEATEAGSVEGLVTAKDEALEAAESLQDRIEELEERGVEAEVVETIRTVTNPIDASLREMLINKKAEMAKLEQKHREDMAAAVDRIKKERPECTGLIRPADCPPPSIPDIKFRFHVESEEARLETDAGNTFAVGSNTIWEGDCFGEDSGGACSEVGEAPWRTDISTLAKAPLPPKRRRLGWYAGLQTAIWRQDRDNYYRASKYRGYGGGEVSFERLDLRMGAYAEEGSVGMDFGVSWHPNR